MVLCTGHNACNIMCVPPYHTTSRSLHDVHAKRDISRDKYYIYTHVLYKMDPITLSFCMIFFKISNKLVGHGVQTSIISHVTVVHPACANSVVI